MLKRRPRAVDFFNRQDDHECVLLASMGFSTAFIVDKTGLSPCQVTYRLQRAGLTKANKTSRMDYRNGKSPFVAPILNMTRSVVDTQLTRFLKAHL